MVENLQFLSGIVLYCFHKNNSTLEYIGNKKHCESVHHLISFHNVANKYHPTPTWKLKTNLGVAMTNIKRLLAKSF